LNFLTSISLIRASSQPAIENAPTQYEAISPELAVSGVELKLFPKNETEEPARYRADKSDVTDLSMTHVKQFSNAEGKQGLDQDDCSGCQATFPSMRMSGRRERPRQESKPRTGGLDGSRGKIDAREN
jgi:hypothetical protein